MYQQKDAAVDAAEDGDVDATADKYSRAVKHWMLAAGAGHDKALKQIRNCYLEVPFFVTKDDFEKALRAHKEATDEMKSDDRDAAAEKAAENLLAF